MEKEISDLNLEYSAWRAKKSKINDRLPSDLIEKTIKIKRKYPKSNLKSLLGLSVATWKKIIAQVGDEEIIDVVKKKRGRKRKEQAAFVKLGLVDSDESSQKNDLSKEKKLALVMTINNIHIQIFN